MAYNIFNDSTTISGDIVIGKRLTNIKNLTISGPRFGVYDSNNIVNTYPFNPAVADILNQSSLEALKTTLLENTEEAIVFQSDSNNQILFHTGLAGGSPNASNLRLEITNSNTTIKNNLVVDGALEIDNIKTTSITAGANDHGFYLYNNPTSIPPPSKQYYFRFIPTASNFVQTESNYITFSPVNSGAVGFQIDHNTGGQVISNYNLKINVSNNDYGLFIAPNNNQACLYSGKQYVGQTPSGLMVQGFFEPLDTNQDRCALKINNYSNLGYRPICFNSANQSKVIFGSDNLHSTDAQNFIVDSASLFSGNVNINGNLTNADLRTTNIKDISGVEFINLNSDIVIKKHIVPETTSTLNIGSTTKLINNAYVNAGNYSTLKTGGNTSPIESGYVLEIGGDTYLKGNILLNTGAVYSIGNITNRLSRIYTGGIISNSFYDSSNSEVFRFSSNVMRLYKPITISTTVQIDLAQSTSPFVNGYITNLYSTTLNASSLTTSGDITIAGVARLNGGINSQFNNIFGGGIQFLDTMLTKDILPITNALYSLGSSSKKFREGYFSGLVSCGQLECNSGFVGGNVLTSDIRIKENIKPLEDDFGIEFIRKLKPTEYKYKTRTRTHLGFIANDIYDILKTDQYSIWSKLKDEMETQSIQPNEFIAPIVKSVQHLDDKIINLEKKVKNLELMNKTLVQLIEKLIKK